MKGPYRLARCRYPGLARSDIHLQLFASAYNLKTAWCWSDEALSGATCAR